MGNDTPDIPDSNIGNTTRPSILTTARNIQYDHQTPN
jgi:hypothetical protein